eukprot:TRINITY_DN25486_c0_g1_i1.p1 TRINITY_DN25486_c0_g1~~TRINITY_DN25486_c0_g1_i1.p1  ORF type:complete len:374 (-),score=88.35 TRINITY_DN25486_c0_g1_i1:102-1223(-)
MTEQIVGNKRKRDSENIMANPIGVAPASATPKVLPSAMNVSDDLPALINSLRYVVVDTNNCLQYLQELLQLKFQSKFQVIIPITVIQELDGIKKQTDDIGFTARQVIKCIYEQTSGKKEGPQWIRVQNYAENPTNPPGALLGSNGVASASTKNDDSILNCAYYFKSQQTTVLITSDYAMAIKAMAWQIPTTDMKGLLKNLPSTQKMITETAMAREDLAANESLDGSGLGDGGQKAMGEWRKVPRAEAIPGFSSEDEAEEDGGMKEDKTGKDEAMVVDKGNDPMMWLTMTETDSTALLVKLFAGFTPEELSKCLGVSRVWGRVCGNEKLWESVILNTFCDGNRRLYKSLLRGKPPYVWYSNWRKTILPARASTK